MQTTGVAVGRHGELRQGMVRVLALDREQHDGALRCALVPLHLGGIGDDGDRAGSPTRRVPRGRGPTAGPAVLAACNQGDVMAALEQAAADGAADGTGPQDDEAHGVHSATRVPSSAPWRR